MNTTINTDLFYKPTKLTIIKAAIAAGANYHIDELNCSKSWRRQPIDMTLDEILTHLEEDSHFVIIFRKNEAVVDIGFSCQDGSRELFLFVNLSVEDLLRNWVDLIIDERINQ